MPFSPRAFVGFLEAGGCWTRGGPITPGIRAGPWTIHWTNPDSGIRFPENPNEKPEYLFPANDQHPAGYLRIFRGYQPVVEGIIIEMRPNLPDEELILWLECDAVEGEVDIDIGGDEERRAPMLSRMLNEEDVGDEPISHRRPPIPVRQNGRPRRIRSWIAISRKTPEIRRLPPPGGEIR